MIGTGRCGLSLVFELLGAHEDLAWFSQWTARFPRSRLAPRLPRLYRKPGIKQLMDLGSLLTGKRWRPAPHEAFEPFALSFRGFGRPYRPLTALDVDQNARAGIREAVRVHVEAQRKTRFIAELSGWARIVFLREIFPDAQFIHVVRDPRATVNSLLNVDWWDGWRGEGNWRYGPIPERYRRFLENGTASFVALASLQYNILIDNAIEEARTLDPASYCEVRFEDVVKDPGAGVRRLCAFLGLPASDRFDREWRKVRVFNPNESTVRIRPWRENLSEAQKRVVNLICAEHLARFGYPLED